jgi:hypothetical protein
MVLDHERLDVYAVALNFLVFANAVFDLRPLPLIELTSNHRADRWNTDSRPWTVRAVCTAISARHQTTRSADGQHRPLSYVPVPDPPLQEPEDEGQAL